MGVCLDTIGDKLTVGNLVASLAMQGSSSTVNLVNTPARVTIDGALNTKNFAFSRKSNLFQINCHGITAGKQIQILYLVIKKKEISFAKKLHIVLK